MNTHAALSALLGGVLLAQAGPSAPRVAPQSPAALLSVRYVQDSVWEADGELLKLLGGSWWLGDRAPLVLPAQEVVIVLADDKRGTLFLKYDRVSVKDLRGPFLAKTVRLGSVVEKIAGGAVLKMSDGSLWSVPQYDRYDTGWWLPPYPALITGDEMYLINLKEGKSVWVDRAR